MSRATNLVISGAILSLLGACGRPPVDMEVAGDPGSTARGPDDQASARTVQGKLLTKVTLEDGASVEFHEPMPGELLTAVIARSQERTDELRALQESSASTAAFYEVLTGQAAPPVLLEAQELVRVAQIEAPAVVEVKPRVSRGHQLDQDPTTQRGDIRQKSSALSSSSFYQSYCMKSSYWDFKYCWLNTSGYTWADWWSTYMKSWINATSGTVYAEIRSWNTFWWASTKITVPRGWTMWLRSSGGFTRRIVEARGYSSSYHMSAYGTVM